MQSLKRGRGICTWLLIAIQKIDYILKWSKKQRDLNVGLLQRILKVCAAVEVHV